MRFLFGLCLLAAAGCSPLVPAYDTELDARVAAAYAGISTQLARGELGALRDPAGFEAHVDDYAAILGDLETARSRVATDDEAQTASAALARLIAACAAQVRDYAAEHRENGIVPQSGIAQPVRTTCDQAQRAARALRG